MNATRNARIATASSVLLILLGGQSSAQWIGYQTKGIPRTADGKPNLSAPTPRTSDGRPDLAGVWQATSDPNDPAGGIEGIVAPKYQINILRDYKIAPMTEWAAGIYQQRNENKLQDNPMIRCLPAGVPRLNAYTHPFKIVQTAGLDRRSSTSHKPYFARYSSMAARIRRIRSRAGWVIRSASGTATSWSSRRWDSTTRLGSTALAIRTATRCG